MKRIAFVGVILVVALAFAAGREAEKLAHPYLPAPWSEPCELTKAEHECQIAVWEASKPIKLDGCGGIQVVRFQPDLRPKHLLVTVEIEDPKGVLKRSAAVRDERKRKESLDNVLNAMDRPLRAAWRASGGTFAAHAASERRSW